jgi:hypothetical protein
MCCFVFTLFYLILLVVGAVNYNKIKWYLTRWYDEQQYKLFYIKFARKLLSFYWIIYEHIINNFEIVIKINKL